MIFVKLTTHHILRNASVLKVITPAQSRSLQIFPLLYSGASKPKGSTEVIRLYDQNGKVIGQKSKQEAETIAKKNGLSLVAMEVIGKPKFPEYKLISRHEAFKLDNEADQSGDIPAPDKKPDRETKKTTRDIKRINFETSIASGDLKVKVDAINNWISKGKEVHLTVVGTNAVALDTFSTQITEMLTKETRFLVKRQKGRNLKLIMDKKLTQDSTDSTESSEDADPQQSKESESSKFQDDFFIDPNLLSNEAELEKILKTKKIK